MIRRRLIDRSLRALLGAAGLLRAAMDSQAADTPAAHVPPAVEAFVGTHCTECHDADVSKGGLDLEALLKAPLNRHPDGWEAVFRRLRTRQMPPPDADRPTEAEYVRADTGLAAALDAVAAESPDPGRTPTFRRLTRTEYGNAIRDLLGIEVDVTTLLPKEDAGHGFDNVTVGTLSPTLLDRYIAAARQISRLAVGSPVPVSVHTVRLPPDLTQEDPVEGLPLGTRGGVLFSHAFPQDAAYEIQVRLTRDRNEEVEGLREPHDVVVLLDRAPVGSFTVRPPGPDRDFEAVDRHLRVRVPVTAGPHAVGVTFVKNPTSLLETRRQPGSARFNMHRHPRLGPAVFQVTVTGPFDPAGPGSTPSRARIFPEFADVSADATEAAGVARRSLEVLARRAYRRPVTDEDLEVPMRLYREAREESGHEGGMEAAIGALLVSPHFLFRVEPDPPGLPPRTPYALDDLRLASRLSFFLWGSLPDDRLLDVAARGDLHRPEILRGEVRRMLADSRAAALARDFAGQWLHLRNLDAFTPDLRAYPDFDDNLRQSLRRETEMLFEDVLVRDRSVLGLLRTDHAFLNERLARHYGIPHVHGSAFRRVDVSATRGGGLLRQGSILAVTSYADRTSPVLRGKWILENLVGTPPPPAPPNVPGLGDDVISSRLPLRQRLFLHRANPGCAGCHRIIDPPGFTLENFDALGRWRTLEGGVPVDASGGLPDGTRCDGVEDLETALLARPEVFVTTVTEKLLTYALGRGLEPSDAPAVRKIVRDAAAGEYRLSSLIHGITRSLPFTHRRTP